MQMCDCFSLSPENLPGTAQDAEKRMNEGYQCSDWYFSQRKKSHENGLGARTDRAADLCTKKALIFR